jgi:hypothetical protein
MNKNDHAVLLPQVNLDSPAVALPLNWVDVLRGELKSRVLHVDNNGDLRVIRNDRAEDDEDVDHVIVLGSAVLPETELSIGQRRLFDEPDLIKMIAHAADRLLQQSTGEAKSQHSVVAMAVRTLCKLVEYLWLNGIYHIRDATAGHFADLGNTLAEGGWAQALRIESRTKRLLDEQGFATSWISSTNAQFSATNFFREALRTSASGPELFPARAVLANYLGWEVSPRERNRSSFSLLLQWFAHCNLLYLIPAKHAITFEPYPNHHATAKLLGRPSARTRNLEVDDAAALLKEGVLCLGSRAESLLELLKRAHKKGKALEGETQTRRIKEFKAWLEIEAEPVVRQWGVFPSGIEGIAYINRCIWSVYASAFTVIAIMNARRRDEVSHRKFGLTLNSMRVVSSELNVYECDFYIEKTYRKRIPFFVNQATFRAWLVLKEYNNLFSRIAGDARKNKSIFWFLHCGDDGIGKGIHRFTFASDTGPVADFVQRALGSAQSVTIGAHAFRRFYCLIFFYRYEHGTLQALAFQLRHLDLEAVRQYVTDAWLTFKGNPLPVELTEEKRVARDAFLAGLDKDLNAVGREKMIQVIEATITGERYAGKFGRLVLKLEAKLASRVDYRGLAHKARPAALADRLISKGYGVEPYVHGDCMAGSGVRRGAKCADRATGVPNKANASPKTCASCAHHRVAKGHITGLEAVAGEIELEQATVPVESLRWLELRRKISDIRVVIRVHRRDLGLECENDC